MNFLIHSMALGDFVLTFPLLRSLAGEPTIVAAPWSKAKLAARLFPGVTPMSTEDRLLTRWHVNAEAGDSPACLAPVQRVFSFVSSGRDTWAENARAALPHAAIHFIQPRPPSDWPGHVTDWHAHQFREQGWDRPTVDATSRVVWHGQAARGGLAVADASGAPAAGKPPQAAAWPCHTIVIHPGSGGREKCWPIAHFETIIHRLRDAGQSVLPILGEVERDRWTPGDLSHWRSKLGAIDVQDLDYLCDLLFAAGAFLGNDSGPAHLAAQLGLPTIALFGPTNPRHWSPRGPRVTVLAPSSPRPMDWLDVDSVWSVLEQLKAPRPG